MIEQTGPGGIETARQRGEGVEWQQTGGWWEKALTEIGDSRQVTAGRAIGRHTHTAASRQPVCRHRVVAASDGWSGGLLQVTAVTEEQGAERKADCTHCGGTCGKLDNLLAPSAWARLSVLPSAHPS